VWSAEKRAEGLEYLHPKPSSHSGRIVATRRLTPLQAELTLGTPGLVLGASGCWRVIL